MVRASIHSRHQKVTSPRERTQGTKWSRSLGSLPRNDDDDDNKNSKKAIGLDKQNNNFAHASRFFVHFSEVVARLQRETA